MITKKALFLYLVLALAGIWIMAGRWLPGEYALVGHDSGLAFNAKDFLLSRVFAWWPHGFGQDNSAHFGSLILHSIDYLSSVLYGVSYAGNRLNVFFWFSTIFISAFLFSYKLKEKLGKFSPFLFPVFITINFFIIQSIFILERAKYSISIASILLLLLCIQVADKKIRPLLASTIATLILFIFNSGSWLGAPHYGGLVVMIVSFIVVEFLLDLKDGDFSRIRRVIRFLLFSVVGFVFVNSYSIIPYVATFLKQDFSSLTNVGVILQNKAWLDSLSKASSFLNFFRLQGVPDWYAGPNEINASHPFAKDYGGSELLVVGSFILPIITFGSILLAKSRDQKRLVGLFGFMSLFSMFFMAGSHEPLGNIFEFFFEHLPGFAIFRSPYYKFGFSFFIGIAGMISFSISTLIERLTLRLKDWKITLGVFLSLGVILLWVGYHGVIFSPEKIFNWQKGYSTRIKIPKYISEFSEYSSSTDENSGRIALLPPLNSSWQNDGYVWGYWSLTDLPSLASSREFIVNDSTLSDEEKSWLNMFYGFIRTGNESRTLSLANRLNITHLLLRKDVISDSSWSAAEDPNIFEQSLQRFGNVEKMMAFGEWTLYRFTNVNPEKFGAISSLVSIPKEASYLSREFLERESVVFQDSPAISSLKDFIYRDLSVQKCVSCILEDAFYPGLPIVSLFPNSKLYFIKEIQDKKAFESAKTEEQKLDAYLGVVLRRTAETMSMISLNVYEGHIVKNLETINNYYSSIYQILERVSDPNTDFSRARQLDSLLSEAARGLETVVKQGNFGRMGDNLREEILESLWNIYKIRKFHSPILDNIEKHEREKIYKINFTDRGEYQLFIKPSELPLDLAGNPISPSVITLNGKKLILSPDNNGWMNLKFRVDQTGENTLILFFDNIPNQFKFKRNSIKPVPVGEKSCIEGKITSYKNSATYLIKILAQRPQQSMKLYIKDNEREIHPSNEFLRGNVEKDVDKISTINPFTYLYAPPKSALDPLIYLCSDSLDQPDVENIEVTELSSPHIVLSSENQYGGKLPKVSSEKITPTKYRVKVENADSPYILTFNERYSPFWGIRDLENVPHFIVDGYMNAWKVSKNGSYVMEIEYNNQNLFYLGALISFIFFLVNLGLCIYLLRRGNEKNKY